MEGEELSSVTKYYGKQKRKKLVNLIIAILAILSLIIILVTVYGQNVGNFVVAVETDVQLALALSETPDFENQTSRLAAIGLKDQTHATYSDIPEDISEGYGSQNDEENKRYFAYSFYIKNTSKTILNYTAEIIFNKATQGAESALRVMVIKNDEMSIYAKAKEYPLSEVGQPEDHLGTGIQVNYTTIPFLSVVTIMRQSETHFPSGAVNKYTIVMWLEGWDRECTDDIKGATMKMEMRFKAFEAGN
ncbi:MAG: hypothetical protein WC292_01060 [Clostridia bacterium]